jgi:nucleoside 2-deoxyribosyltransferase
VIHIVGGSYVEVCVDPPWQQIYGSGLRAAVAVKELAGDVELTTYCGDNERNDVEYAATLAEVKIDIGSAPKTITFYYYHGLSEPQIRPTLHLISKVTPRVVRAQHILRFGFLEADAIVHGERVVYDPQSAYAPRPFHENGSTAVTLAVVANLREARLLTGHNDAASDIQALGRAVLEREGAEVVVIKRGSVGATIVTDADVVDVPAYRTKSVWPIGSGDVFAAVFAHYWTSGTLEAKEAAAAASLATAYYCENRLLPIPSDLSSIFSPTPIISGPDNFPSKPKQVYLAGPFFTTAQRWMIEESRQQLLGQMLKVFSPYHNVGHGPASKVVPADIKALDESDIVFALADGLDSGTIFEIGYARAKGKPVIVFVQRESEGDLKMLEGTGCEIVDDFASAIYRATWAAMAL